MIDDIDQHIVQRWYSTYWTTILFTILLSTIIDNDCHHWCNVQMFRLWWYDGMLWCGVMMLWWTVVVSTLFDLLNCCSDVVGIVGIVPDVDWCDVMCSGVTMWCDCRCDDDVRRCCRCVVLFDWWRWWYPHVRLIIVVINVILLMIIMCIGMCVIIIIMCYYVLLCVLFRLLWWWWCWTDVELWLS